MARLLLAAVCFVGFLGFGWRYVVSGDLLPLIAGIICGTSAALHAIQARVSTKRKEPNGPKNSACDHDGYSGD